MKTNRFLFTLLFFTISIIAFAQNQTAKVAGIVLDENNKPIEGVTISYQTKSARTNENGFYELTVPANQKIILVFTHTALKSITVPIQLKLGENFEYHVMMNDKAEQLQDVVVTSSRRRVQGITSIEPETIRRNPSANAGIESLNSNSKIYFQNQSNGITITWKEIKNLNQILVSDLNGRLIKNVNSNLENGDLQLELIESGYYLVQFFNENNRLIGSLNVVH